MYIVISLNFHCECVNKLRDLKSQKECLTDQNCAQSMHQESSQLLLLILSVINKMDSQSIFAINVIQ